MASASFTGPEGQEDMPFLLTPGPVTTTRGVKLAMLADYGSREDDFRKAIAEIRRRLLAIAGASKGFECVPVQGSGTFAMEAALGAFAPTGRAKTLVAANGVYGRRAAAILERIGRPYALFDAGDRRAIMPGDLERALKAERGVTHVWLTHCETTSGVVNPLKDLAGVCADHGKRVLVDAISSFGAIPVAMEADGLSAVAASPNKCLEGVPGFAFVIARRAMLETAQGKSHSLVLDLHGQWRGFEETGQFRFTPPTHALIAFLEALRAHEAEGGAAARGARYLKNAHSLVKGMRALGFTPLLDDASMGPVIQTFLMPKDPAFDFARFRAALRKRGFAIYPGALTDRASFRVGTIGAIDDRVIAAALAATAAALESEGFKALDLGGG